MMIYFYCMPTIEYSLSFSFNIKWNPHGDIMHLRAASPCPHSLHLPSVQPFYDTPSPRVSLAQASVPCGHVFFCWQWTISLQVQPFRDSPMWQHVWTSGVNPAAFPSRRYFIAGGRFLESTWLKWNDGRWKWARWHTFSSASSCVDHSSSKSLWNGRLRCNTDMWAPLCVYLIMFVPGL